MKTLVTTYFYPNYKPLADITVYRNLFKYCILNHYNFAPYELQIEDSGDRYQMACLAGLHKAQQILKVLEAFPDTDYVFHRDCDSVITNASIKVENIIEKYPFDILTGTDKAGISDGQMIVKNSPKAKDYIKEYLDKADKYEHQQDFFHKNPVHFLYGTPQRVMNAYDCFARLEPMDDPGNWQEGDFLVHLTGLTIEQRMGRVGYWVERVK